jgi:hypothetical protein
VREVTLRLRGLDANRTYRVAWPASFGKLETATGADLLQKGLTIRFPYQGASAIVPIAAQN